MINSYSENILSKGDLAVSEVVLGNLVELVHELEMKVYIAICGKLRYGILSPCGLYGGSILMLCKGYQQGVFLVNTVYQLRPRCTKSLVQMGLVSILCIIRDSYMGCSPQARKQAGPFPAVDRGERYVVFVQIQSNGPDEICRSIE